MSDDLINQIEKVISSKSLLAHPFYQGWTKGSVTMEELRIYAREYYHFELAYPTFLSGIHHRCDDRQMRQLLLENLWDEEQGTDNHVELWLRFCDALGLDRNEVETCSPAASTAKLVQTYKDLTTQGGLAAGTTALYAYESQVPKVAGVKRDGLVRHYGISDERALAFFEVHRTMDEEHSEAEKKMITTFATSPSDRVETLEAVRQATSVLWGFLDGVRAS